jgi:hypothetical protein
VPVRTLIPWLLGALLLVLVVSAARRSSLRRHDPRRVDSRRPTPTRPGAAKAPTRPGRAPALRASPPDASWQHRPRPGEIWWATVPYDDGTGSKVRPCLVLRTYRTRVEVLKITSQDQSDRADHIEIPTRAWDRKAEHNSFLDLSDPYQLRDGAFERKAGVIDDRTWTRVRREHATGFGS